VPLKRGHFGKDGPISGSKSTELKFIIITVDNNKTKIYTGSETTQCEDDRAHPHVKKANHIDGKKFSVLAFQAREGGGS
jgi:hypothetical protein